MSSDSADLPPFGLLQLLSDGENHSGQELANCLGVSRTAIWKQLSKLEALGLELISVSGKGYRLVGGLDLLDPEEISNNLTPETQAGLHQLSVLASIDSTNAYLMRQDVAQAVSACFAEHQTAGRGRRGRQWVSPFAGNIYLSLRFSSNGGLGAFEGVSLATGVVVARALKELGVENVSLKWPNDILIAGKKLGGILIEVVGDPSGVCHLVVGLGLNIKTLKSMTDVIDQPWIALDQVKTLSSTRNGVASCLLNQLVPMLNSYENKGFGEYKGEWENLNAYVDQQVELHVGNSKVLGLMKGVNASGAILLETSNGIEVFHGGEVTLRGAT